MWGLRRSKGEPLVVSMAGINVGERVLVLGSEDGALNAGAGVKSGFSGRTCIFGASRERVAAAVKAAEDAGALVEGFDGAWWALPFDEATFDVVLVRDVLPPLPRDGRSGTLAEVRRVLRQGGRVMVIDTTDGSGPLGRLRLNADAARFYGQEGGASRALEDAGFKAVRPLAERDGLVFTEGARVSARTSDGGRHRSRSSPP